MNPRAVICIFLALMAASIGTVLAEADTGGETLEVTEWLVLGPVAHPLPAFHDEERGGVAVADLLDEITLPGALQDPRRGARRAPRHRRGRRDGRGRSTRASPPAGPPAPP